MWTFFVVRRGVAAEFRLGSGPFESYIYIYTRSMYHLGALGARGLFCCFWGSLALRVHPETIFFVFPKRKAEGG